MLKNKTLWFYIIFFIFIFSICITAKGYDYDLWARLIVGKYFFQTLSVMKQDIVSYIPTNTWYDHEWGSGVIFYFVLHFFSYYGIIFLEIGLIFLLYFFITKCIKKQYNLLFFICSFLAMAKQIAMPIRSQLFTFLLFTIFIYIFEKERKENKPKLLWILPILMIFWNNVHGGCVAGLGLFIFYIVGEFLNKKPIKKYFLPATVSLLVLPINPWGISYINYLFTATTMARPEIIEWANLFNPKFNNAYMEFKIFLFTLLTTQLFYLIKFRPKIDWTKYIITFSTLYLAISHIKHIPLCVITFTIFFYEDFYIVFNHFTRNIFKKNIFARIKNGLVYILFILFIISNPSLYNIKPCIEWTKYPIRIVEFIKLNDIKGNILTDFAQGSFISYKLYPHNKIYMDGRYEELYFKETFDDLMNFTKMKNNWDSLEKKYPPDIIIFNKKIPVCDYLAKSDKWTLLFDDNNFYLFIKTKNLKDSYIDSPIELQYYQKHLFDTNINFMID